MNLIEELGIEKCRAIVEGAPDWPVIGYCTVGNNYIFKQCEHAPFSYSNLDNAWSEEYAIHFVSLSDLRTAIAAYDCNPTDNLSHLTDNCTDIRNHISPNTKVIER